MTSRSLPLLELLDGFVRERPEHPGLLGYLSFGVEGEAGYRGWFADFDGPQTRTGFVDFVPTAADTVVILGEAEAASLLLRGTIDPGSTQAVVRGHRGVLEAFIAQFLKSTNWLALRAGPPRSRPMKRRR